MTEPGRVRRRLPNQDDASWRKEPPPRCLPRGSTPMSCASVLFVSSLSPAVRSPTSPGIWASTTRRFASGCASRGRCRGPRRSPDHIRARAAESTRVRGQGAAARQRDLRGPPQLDHRRVEQGVRHRAGVGPLQGRRIPANVATPRRFGVMTCTGPHPAPALLEGPRAATPSMA